jgi:hypothetical protein
LLTLRNYASSTDNLTVSDVHSSVGKPAVGTTLLFLLVAAHAGPLEAFSFISFHLFGGFSPLALFLYRNSLIYASAAADEGADLILLSNYALMEGI